MQEVSVTVKVKVDPTLLPEGVVLTKECVAEMVDDAIFSYLIEMEDATETGDWDRESEAVASQTPEYEVL